MLQLQQPKLQASDNTASLTSYVKIPAPDLLWISTKKLSVIQLFLDAWASDPYGSRYVELQHNLKPTAFRLARKLLTEQGLFIFKRDVSVIDPRATNCWLVKNLHGARCSWTDNAALVPEDDATALDDTATALESVAPAPPILAKTLVQPALPEPSLSIHNHLNNQQQNSEEVVAGLETATEEENTQVQPSREETREALTKLREMGMRLNPTLQALVLKHYSNVANAIAHIKERVREGERFKNLEGAFVKAVRDGAKPKQSQKSWGYHAEVNPPSLEQLAALDNAKASGLIRDYYLSSDNVCKVVQLSFDLIPWWQYLTLPNSVEFGSAELDT